MISRNCIIMPPKNWKKYENVLIGMEKKWQVYTTEIWEQFMNRWIFEGQYFIK